MLPYRRDVDESVAPRSRPSPARMRRHASGDSDDAPPVRAPAGSTLYDFALNYDDETPLRPMDIGGADQEQQCV
jgi:hypothetical protein